MTLSEANSALRLFGLKLDRDASYSKDAYKTSDSPHTLYRYMLTAGNTLHDLGNWDLPVQKVYEYVVETFT